MNDFQPYTADELRRIRRLIIASGASVTDWSAKLRRSADYLQSLSPGQANIVANQALAIAADPDDTGDAVEMIAAYEELSVVPKGERTKYLSRHVIELRRRYFTGPPDPEDDGEVAR